MTGIRALQDRLRQSLWVLPALFASAAAVLALALTAVDRELSRDPGALWFMFGGTAEGARSVLSTIAQSMLTFTGLVFTITMLVLQLATSQLSPRVMRTFLRDRGNQTVLGLFVATFVYTLLVLRDVRAEVDGEGGFVPALSIWVAFALLIASIAAFIYYINHMAHAIRASTVIENIWEETRRAIDREHRDPVGEREVEDRIPPATDEEGSDGPERLVENPQAGVIVTIDEDRLLELAGDGDRRIVLLAAVGDFVPEGAPIARLVGTGDGDAADDVLEAVGHGRERTLVQDAAFGVRQLVDIANRALSPGTNDPSTAVQALDRIHDLMRRWSWRAMAAAPRQGEDGVQRVFFADPSWEELVHLAFDEIRIAGRTSIQVNRRLRHVLLDLLSVAPDHRRPVLRDLLERLDAAVAEAFSNTKDVADLRRPSPRGHARQSVPGKSRNRA